MASTGYGGVCTVADFRGPSPITPVKRYLNASRKAVLRTNPFLGSEKRAKYKVPVPEGFSVPKERTKPWGTSHAVLCAQEAIGDAPFAVINADDYDHLQIVPRQQLVVLHVVFLKYIKVAFNFISNILYTISNFQ